MYAANVSPGASPTSIRTLINTAFPNQIPPIGQVTGRCYQIILTFVSGTTAAVSFGTDATNAASLVTNVPVSLGPCPTGNQLSIDEVFLSGTGTPVVSVIVLVL